MEGHISYSQIEQKILPDYREKMNHAESTEDVKKFFVYKVQDLFDKALGEKVTVEYEDIQLDFEHKDNFHVSERLLDNDAFIEAWENSDLPHIVARFAETARNRYKYFDTRHPDRTESKMFPKADRTDRRVGGH